MEQEQELIYKKDLFRLRRLAFVNSITDTREVIFISDIDKLPIITTTNLEAKKQKNINNTKIFNDFAWTLVKDFAGCCHDETDVNVLIQLLKAVRI